MMLEERVSVIIGKKPLIYVAPHGNVRDDCNTDLIAEILANTTDGYAVINRGFEKSDNVDVSKDKANCNNVEHCQKDVIKEEFFDPLIRFKNKILKKWTRVCIVYLHGMSNDITVKTGIPNLHYIVGWGRGTPNSFTCQKWIKDYLVYNLSTVDNCKVAEGKAGGKYAAWARNNMAQLFRKWHPNEDVDAVQIEIINKIRNTPLLAETTAQVIAITIEGMLDEDKWELPYDFTAPRV